MDCHAFVRNDTLITTLLLAIIYFSKLVNTLQSSTFPIPFHIYSTIEQKRNSLAEGVEHSVSQPVGQSIYSPPISVDSFLKTQNHFICLKKYHSLLCGSSPGHADHIHHVSQREYCKFQVLLVQSSIIKSCWIPLA